MVLKIRRHSMDSIKTELGKAEVGEIDTAAPFESVKAAVSLFGKRAISGPVPPLNKAKPAKAPCVENTLAKETQLQLAQKELDKLKEQLQNADTTKSQALVELDNAKRLVEDLTNKLRTINESKEKANKVTEAAKDQVKHHDEGSSGEPAALGGAWEEELEKSREQYAEIVSELDAAKQELTKIRQDLEASKEAKVAAFQQTAEAMNAAKANTEKADEISKEIVVAQESLVQVKIAAVEAQQEQAKMLCENDAQRQSEVAVLEEKLDSLKKELVPDLTGDLEDKLAETSAQIGALQKEIAISKGSDINIVEDMSSEVLKAKEELGKIIQEKSSLQSTVDSLKMEVESVRKEYAELREKETKIETLAADLNIELEKSKATLELVLAESKAASDDELFATLEQLSSESANAKQEAEEMNETAEELKKEAETNRISLEEAKKKLEVILKEAEEAKAAEAQALEHIKSLSERTTAARASTSETETNITISTEEFEALKRKVEECEALAKIKEDAALAQVEAVKASENEALKKVETSWKEIKDLTTAAETALKSAAMAEAAKNAIDGELHKWREREQKKAAEAAKIVDPPSDVSSPGPPEILEKQGSKKIDKKYGSKKALASLSGIFHKKKIQVDAKSASFSGQRTTT